MESTESGFVDHRLQIELTHGSFVSVSGRSQCLSFFHSAWPVYRAAGGRRAFALRASVGGAINAMRRTLHLQITNCEAAVRGSRTSGAAGHALSGTGQDDGRRGADRDATPEGGGRAVEHRESETGIGEMERFGAQR
ncbi:hypothetical protein G3O06_08760 [Burkholderia sp. Ac-20345]|uniref:hypothetical protein n=1 Tax=Burkholderia sp. Ac-20345 TaxID=2703891 RepID=UPI00197B91E7|nr:hypothetical protein [Burkholderia sp. Ac-20345]MBN3777641.1 hypothetical protein [Burkholderia sp. Ac-20345]